METKTVDFKGLDKLIAECRENTLRKKAVLIVKSQCSPYKGKEIPKHVIVKVASNAKSSEEFLANAFAEEDNDAMFEFHSGLAEELGQKVVRLIFKEEEEEE